MDDTPFHASRQEWDDRVGNAAKDRDSWKQLAFFLAIIVVAMLGWNVYNTSQQKLMPFAVEIDRQGTVIAVSKLNGKSLTVDQRNIKAALSAFITNLRSVSVDAAMVIKMQNDAYAFLSSNDPSKLFLDEYILDPANYPLERAKTETVAVEIKSVLSIANSDSWQVVWREDVRSRSGELLLSKSYKATLRVRIAPPTTEQQVYKNPMGIYVSDLSWGEELF